MITCQHPRYTLVLTVWSVLIVSGVVAQIVGSVSTLAGGNGGIVAGSSNGIGTASTFNNPNGVAMDAAGTVAVVVSVDNGYRNMSIGVVFASDRRGEVWLEFVFTCMLCLQADTNNHMVRLIEINTGAVSTLAGSNGISGTNDALATNARFKSPYGVAVDAVASFALVVSSIIAESLLCLLQDRFICSLTVFVAG